MPFVPQSVLCSTHGLKFPGGIRFTGIDRLHILMGRWVLLLNDSRSLPHFLVS